jgi:RNA polymerase sigma-70 factor (ECF subfamily)
VHSDAGDAVHTDWPQILTLYDHLMSVAPGPVVALNRAVAVAQVAGPEAALHIVNALDLPNYHLFHAVRADLLRRTGRDADAAVAYQAAIAACANLRERQLLEREQRAICRN